MMASAAMGKQTIAPPTRRPEPKIKQQHISIIMEIARTMRKPAVPKRHTPQIQDMNNDRRQVKQIQNNIVSIVEQISKVAIQSKAITV